MRDKRKSVDESEMKRCEEMLKNNTDGIYHNMNKFLYENAVEIYNLRQSILKCRMYRWNKEEEPIKKKIKNN